MSTMPENEPSVTASKFVASLVKSLQLICNGDVNFSECVELVGYINVRVDNKLKFDYVVDEQVCKDRNDSSTKFLSNSYHSSPRYFPSAKDAPNEAEKDISTGDIIDFTLQETIGQASSRDQSLENLYSVKVQSPRSQANHMVVKLEGGDDSNDCMVLPTTDGSFEKLDESGGVEAVSASSSRPAEDSGDKMCTRKKQKEKDLDEGDTICDSIASFVNKASDSSLNAGNLECDPNSHMNGVGGLSDVRTITESHFQGPPDNDASIKSPKNMNNKGENTLKDFKLLVTKLLSLCDLPIIQDELMVHAPKEQVDLGANDQDLKTVKKNFLENFSKENLKKLKETMKMKKGKLRKKKLRAILAEAGFSSEQLLLLTQESSALQRNIKLKNSVFNADKSIVSKEQRKQMRSKTQERQQKLLEMTEMLKKNQGNDPGITVVSKNGDQKCALHKSSVSVVSHSSLQLTVDNIDEAAEALTGKNKSYSVLSKCDDKNGEQIKADSRKCVIKKKMKQIIGKMLSDVNEGGYHVVVTSTVGSETGSHSADLSVLPIKIDDFLPEMKESEVKPEITEEEYAKQLEREQILEKQKVSEEKMKAIESKLARILSGVEEMFVPTRKRYGAEIRPSDAERMKEYRKRLKQYPEKYQMYKQKRVMNKKWRRLGQLAAKVKVNSSNATVTVIPASVNDESHVSQPMSALVSMNQSVGSVNMHCPQVFEHPSGRQPSSSVVNVHHSNQFVGQVSGMHPTHQPPPISYGNDMEFVELMAASHTVPSQHFG